MPVATGGASAPPTLTVAVLTLNEAHRIEACLQSAAFADQLLVVDSGSTDDTVAIAQRLGAEVHSYPDWKGFAVQRNRLLAHARGDYIFFLDADEVMTPAFAQELQATLQTLAALQGQASGINFRTATPARIEPVGGGYRLQP